MSAIQKEVTIGECRLILGDCLQVMPELGRFDAVITDPPYGIGFPYNTHKDTEENLIKIIPGLMDMVFRCGRGVITPGNTNLHKYPAPNWTGAWTWNTTTSRGKWGWSQWQPILLYGEDAAKGTSNINGVLKSDRIDFSGGSFKSDRSDGRGHSCPKPLEFMRRLLNRFTFFRETVLDPFMGSGTTGVACVKLGRKFTGIELDPDYFEIAVQRIKKAYEQPDMFIEAEKAPVPVQEGMDL